MLYFMIIVMVVFRIIEIVIAQKNEKILISLHEAKLINPKEHFYVYGFHALWFISLLVESIYRHKIHTGYSALICYVMLIIAMIIRFESMNSLGVFWTTKIYQSVNQKISYEGLYKWFAHPSYFAVVLEFFFLPFLLNAHITLAIFFPLNLLLIANRIKLEKTITGRVFL